MLIDLVTGELVDENEDAAGMDDEEFDEMMDLLDQITCN